MSAVRRAIGASILFTLAAVTGLASQYQVNPQLNTELYGHGVGSVGRSNLPSYQASLRSDARHDMFLSGATRSDVRGQYAAVGPLAPSGATSYIPSVARPYGQLGSPSGGLESGGYSPAPQPRNTAGYWPGVSGSGASSGYGGSYTPGASAGSVRYAPNSAYSTGVPLPGPLDTGQPASFGTSYGGSVRYGY